MLIIASDHPPIGFRRNDNRGVHCLDTVNEASGVKGFVGDDSANVLHAIDEISGFGDVVPFATAQTEACQIAQPIYRGMNFGAQLTSISLVPPLWKATGINYEHIAYTSRNLPPRALQFT